MRAQVSQPQSLNQEIIRMFNHEFNEFAKNPKLDFYPESLRTSIDSHNDFMYERINNGVYRCGFAKTQAACNFPKSN